MSTFDVVPAILEPYDTQFSIWEGEGKEYKQHDLVPAVGMAPNYAVRLNAPPEEPPRFLTVQENRITNLMAHQPIPGASVFDQWGKYLGRGGEPLAAPNQNVVNSAISMVEQVAKEAVSQIPAVQEAAGAVDRLKEATQELNTLVEDEDVECHRHRFWLREDLEVKVVLPLDLTDEEARRLAIFMTTLPLSAKTSE